MEHASKQTAATQTRKHKTTWKWALLAVLVCVCGILILEGGVRVLRGTVLMVEFTGADTHLWATLHQPDPLLMWSMRPNLDTSWTADAQGARWRVQTNALGLREDAVALGADRVRILALGDSCTFGLGVNQGQDWPAQLQKCLGHGEVPPEVINAGVLGYTAFQGLRYFQYRGAELRPQLTLAAFGLNDLQPPHRCAIGDLEWEEIRSPSAFITVVRGILRVREEDNLLPTGLARARLSRGEFYDCMRALVHIFYDNETTPVLLIWPLRSDLDAPDTESAHAALISLAAEETGAACIDLRVPAREAGPHIFLDSCHLTPEGYQLMAAYLSRELKRLFPEVLQYASVCP